MKVRVGKACTCSLSMEVLPDKKCCQECRLNTPANSPGFFVSVRTALAGVAAGAHLHQHRNLLVSFLFPDGASLRCGCNKETKALKELTSPGLQRGRAAVPTRASLPPKLPLSSFFCPRDCEPPMGQESLHPCLCGSSVSSGPDGTLGCQRTSEGQRRACVCLLIKGDYGDSVDTAWPWSMVSFCPLPWAEK